MPGWINETFFVILVALSAALAFYIVLMMFARYVIPDRILSPAMVRRATHCIHLPRTRIALDPLTDTEHRISETE